jgi:hypothetical protein
LEGRAFAAPLAYRYVIAMTDGQRFVLLIARMVELLRNKPGGVEEAKEVLRSLAEQTTRRSWTVRLKGPELTVEGSVIPTDTPPIPLLVGTHASS